MKCKVISLIASVAFSVLALPSCQIVELVKSGTTYYDTEITTRDGQLVTGRIGGQRSSNLPSAAKTISIKTDQGRRKIKSEQIRYMTLARKGHPEKQQTLIYSDLKWPYTRKGQQKFRTFKSWMILKHAGDHLLITAHGGSYSLSKDGALVITYKMEEGIKYCIMRPGDDCPILIGRSISGRASMRRQWAEYLADDPALCDKIQRKEIDAFDFKTIAEQYSPGK